MIKLALSIAATAGLAGALAAIPSPAQAQGATTGEIIVYGDDPCPRSTDDDIVVCTRRPEQERYRLPNNMRPSGTRQQGQSWSNRVQTVMQVGATGTGTCSAVGPGGHTGCLAQEIRENSRAAAEAANQATAPEQ